ncbi:MAG TPA: ATP synthase F0 subunit C [Bryobacteraceae bacterium]|jgi:F-type H+-transporting ATPase subunit c
MKSKQLFVLFMFLFILTAPTFAQGTTAAAPGSPVDLKPLIPLAMGLASGLCGLGQGKAVAGAAEAIARNPGAAAAIRFALILGLVLIESLALYTLVVVFRS